MENDRSYTRQFVLSAETYDYNLEIIRISCARSMK